MERKLPIAWLLFAVLAVVTCWPLLQPSHVEVLSVQMQINAIAANEGRLADANVQYPIHVEYFYLSRVGVIYLLQAMTRWLGDGDAAFRLLTQLFFVVFVASSIAIACRFGKVRALAAAGALLLTPGVAPIGFFFSDSAVSVGLGMLSIAAVPTLRSPSGSPWVARAMLAGGLLGASMLARVDALLLVPVVAGLAWIEGRNPRALLLLAVPFAAGVGLVLLLSFGYSGHSIFESIAIGAQFNALHAFARRPALLLAAAGLFFGALNIVLLPMGAVQVLREFDWKGRWVLVGLPLVMGVYFLGHSVQVRHFYPLLTPFVAILGGKALERFAADLRAAKPSVRARAFVVAAALVWLAPPLYVPVMEGPRPVVGQLWSPILWHRWHAGVSESLRHADTVVNAAETTADVGVITLEANADAFMRLRLWQRGFRPIPLEQAAPGCRGAIEGWRKGRQQLLMVRTENPHLMAREGDAYVTAVLLRRALGCPGLRRSTRVFAFGLRNWDDAAVAHYVLDHVPGLPTKEIFYGAPGRLARPVTRDWLQGLWPVPSTSLVQQVVLLTPEQMAALAKAADDDIAAATLRAGRPLSDYDGLMREFRPRVWDPRVAGRP